MLKVTRCKTGSAVFLSFVSSEASVSFDPSRKIRVLVVDDSFFMRQVVTRMVQEEPDFEVVGTARDGQEAVEKNQSLKPDVVTLDVEMPGLDGMAPLTRCWPPVP